MNNWCLSKAKKWHGNAHRGSLKSLANANQLHQRAPVELSWYVFSFSSNIYFETVSNFRRSKKAVTSRYWPGGYYLSKQCRISDLMCYHCFGPIWVSRCFSARNPNFYLTMVPRSTESTLSEATNMPSFHVKSIKSTAMCASNPLPFVALLTHPNHAIGFLQAISQVVQKHLFPIQWSKERSALIFVAWRFECFLKWWYPQNTPKWSFFVGKPMVVGYHHFRKPPFRHSEISIPFQLEAQCNPVTLCAAAAVAAGDEGRRDNLYTKRYTAQGTSDTFKWKPIENHYRSVKTKKNNYPSWVLSHVVTFQTFSALNVPSLTTQRLWFLFQRLGESWGGASAGAGKGGFDADSASSHRRLKHIWGNNCSLLSKWYWFRKEFFKLTFWDMFDDNVLIKTEIFRNQPPHIWSQPF